MSPARAVKDARLPPKLKVEVRFGENRWWMFLRRWRRRRADQRIQHWTSL